MNIIVDNPTKLIEWSSPVGICVFAMEALKKKIFSTLLRHVPLIISIIVSILIRDNFLWNKSQNKQSLDVVDKPLWQTPNFLDIIYVPSIKGKDGNISQFFF